MEWIDVGDRLPTSTGLVRVRANDIVSSWNEVVNAYICPEYGNLIWEDRDGEDYVPIITHWRPMK